MDFASNTGRSNKKKFKSMSYFDKYIQIYNQLWNYFKTDWKTMMWMFKFKKPFYRTRKVETATGALQEEPRIVVKISDVLKCLLVVTTGIFIGSRISIVVAYFLDERYQDDDDYD